jgi:hypothetical protein
VIFANLVLIMMACSVFEILAILVLLGLDHATAAILSRSSDLLFVNWDYVFGFTAGQVLVICAFAAITSRFYKAIGENSERPSDLPVVVHSAPESPLFGSPKSLTSLGRRILERRLASRQRSVQPTQASCRPEEEPLSQPVAAE